MLELGACLSLFPHFMTLMMLSEVYECMDVLCGPYVVHESARLSLV